MKPTEIANQTVTPRNALTKPRTVMATTGKEPIELFGKSVHGALSFLNFLTVVNSGNKFIFWRNVDTLTTTGNGTKLKKKLALPWFL